MENPSSLPAKVESADGKKKKSDKWNDLLRRNLTNFSTNDEKIDYLCQKYSEINLENREMKDTNQSVKKQLQITQRDKDQLTKEYNKVVLQKASLESLCRELQKQKQIIQEEGLTRNRAEEEKRKEISNLFRTKIIDIENQMTTYQENNDKLRQENQDLAMKLSKFVEQFELKEQQTTKILQTKHLESQLSEAKLKQSQCFLEEVTVKFKQETEQVHKQLEEQRIKINMHQQLEEKLKEQIEFYRSKYEEFQTTLNDSNQVFATCKKEMEKMSNTIKKLEKDNIALKQKWENSNCSTLTLASEKAQADEQITSLKAKVEKLESLCRALQTERVSLRQQLEAKPAVVVTNDVQSPVEGDVSDVQ